MPTKHTYRELAQQLRHTNALAHCSQALLQGSPGAEINVTVLNAALGHLARGTGIARVGLFQTHWEPDSGHFAHIIAEATSPGFAPRLHSLWQERIPTSVSTVQKHQAGQTVSVFLNEIYTPDELAALDVRSLLLCPILIEKNYWGYVAYGAAEQERQWLEHERMVLQTAAEMFGRTLQNWQVQASLEEQQRETNVLIDFIRLMSNLQTVDQAINLAVAFVAERFNLAQCIVYTKAEYAYHPAEFRAATSGAGWNKTNATAVLDNLRDRVLARNRPLMLLPDRSDDTNSTNSCAADCTILGLPMNSGEDMQAVMIVVAPPEMRVPFSSGQVRLLETIARQTSVSIQKAQLYERKQQVVVLEERQRLARDLHDSVTQSLYSLVLQADGGIRLARAGKMDDIEEYLSDLGAIALQSLKELRLLVYELRPSLFTQENFLDSLRKRLNAVEERAGTSTTFNVDPDITFSPAEQEALWGIAQEALNNALKHAQAPTVRIRIYSTAHGRQMEITDDGIGFDISQKKTASGLGLDTMRERAALIGGVFTLQSAIGSGTTVRVEVP